MIISNNKFWQSLCHCKYGKVFVIVNTRTWKLVCKHLSSVWFVYLAHRFSIVNQLERIWNWAPESKTSFNPKSIIFYKQKIAICKYNNQFTPRKIRIKQTSLLITGFCLRSYLSIQTCQSNNYYLTKSPTDFYFNFNFIYYKHRHLTF